MQGFISSPWLRAPAREARTVCVLLGALVLSYSASLPVVPARWSGSGTAPRGSRIWLGPVEVCSRDGLERAAPSLLAAVEEDGSCQANCVEQSGLLGVF